MDPLNSSEGSSLSPFHIFKNKKHSLSYGPGLGLLHQPRTLEPFVLSHSNTLRSLSDRGFETLGRSILYPHLQITRICNTETLVLIHKRIPRTPTPLLGVSGRNTNGPRLYGLSPSLEGNHLSLFTKVTRWISKVVYTVQLCTVSEVSLLCRCTVLTGLTTCYSTAYSIGTTRRSRF